MNKVYVVYQKPAGGQVSVLFATFNQDTANNFVREHIGPQYLFVYWVDAIEVRL